jgi:hypothetical protein
LQTLFVGTDPFVGTNPDVEQAPRTGVTAVLKKIVVGALLSLAAAQGANAAVVKVSGAFEATDWYVWDGKLSPSPPIDPLFLDYTATFDDSLIYDGDPAIVRINRTNIPYHIAFSFDGSTIILATRGVAGACSLLPSSFCAFVNYADEAARGDAYFVDQSPPSGGGWAAATITNHASSGERAPEPATWALMIGGFGMAGAMLRRQRLVPVKA